MRERVVGVERFSVAVPQATLDDLQQRLARTRWPGELDGPGWQDGTSPAFLRELVDWWQTDFDWRAQEAAINRFPQFRATVDGVGLHFVHVRGKGPAPLPLVLTHGWPSTFYELLPLVPLLTDPASHGGDPADAFDVVVPPLPGYGFSDPLPGQGSSNRVPGLWVQLMSGVLGYARFGAHGGDIGAMVANRLALEHPERLLGIHVTRAAEPYVGPGAVPLTEAEQALLAARARWHEAEGGYAHLQRTRPQTLAYGLSDSPVGLAAWIVEKWWAWSDCGGEVERRFTKDQLLTTVMLYWVTGTIDPRKLGWPRCSDAVSLATTATDGGRTPMFARTSRWSGDPAALDKWAEHVMTKVAPMVQGLAGNAGAVFLIDRQANQALTLTLWDSEPAALASDQAAERSRSSTMAATGVELVDRGRYQVVARL